eukprot:scaffold190794_cov35-Attheya_sp.AAC.3
MQQWLTRNTPFIKYALKIAKIQLKKNASDIRRFIPNAPILKTKSRMKVKRCRDTKTNANSHTGGTPTFKRDATVCLAALFGT